MSLQESCYQWNAKPPNEGKHFYENVGVKFDVKTQGSRKLCCKTTKTNKKRLLEANLTTYLKNNNNKLINHIQEKKVSIFISN